MAENLRRGDRVDWHGSPQMTTDPQNVKRGKSEHGSAHQHTASDDGGEGPNPNDHR